MAHKVGSDIDAWCTRCRLDTIHVVVSLKADGDTAKRAECKSCGGQHNYRPPKSGPNTKTKRKTAKKKTTKRRTGESKKTVDWSERVAAFQTSGTEPKKYTIRGEFAADDFIDHVKFGLGIVIELAAANKISVMFEDGPRTLIMMHGR